MIITALVIASSIVSISLAQSQPSPECIAAYNATFDDPDGLEACERALRALIIGPATDQEQMMVCDEGQQCNAMIENVTNICGDTIDFPSRYTLDLVCGIGPNGSNCFNLIFQTDIQLYPNCFGCTPDCNQTLMQLNSTLGCCFTEYYQLFLGVETTYLTNGFPGVCNYPPFPLCNGTTLPPTECSDATVDLFSIDDPCTRALHDFFDGNGTAIVGVYFDDCPMRFLNYATACMNAFGDGLVQFANAVVATSETTNSDGRLCYEILLVEEESEPFLNDCVMDFLLRQQCTSNCTQIMESLTTQYECCFNTIIGEFNGRSIEVSEQIEYPIFTREIYSQCEIASGGFCSGVTPPSDTNAAIQCINARNSFFDDETCLDYYLTLGLRSSISEVSEAARAVCTERCYSRMSEYLNYIRICRLGDFGHDDDDDDDDDEVDPYLELVYLTGNTTCRVDDSSNTSCYASITTNPMYDNVSAAFGDDGACESVPEGRCSEECIQLLTQAHSNLECCAGEYIRVQVDTDIDVIAAACGIPINVRCSNIAPTDTGGAGTHKGFGMPIVLLGMIAIALS